MRYRGKPVTQLDGSTFAHSNCVLAVSRKLADLWTLGFWQPTPKALRVATGDTSGGVTFTQAELATRQRTDDEVKLAHLYWSPSATLDDMITAGREAGVMIRCSVTVTTPYRTGSFTGLHLVAVLARRVKTWTDSAGVKHTQKQGLVMDPGHSTAKFVWWPWSLILKAAQSVTGGNGIHLLYGRDRVAVARVAAGKGAIRSTAAVISSPSNVVGNFSAGATVTIADTVEGKPYNLDGRTGLTGWNKLGAGRYAVAKIR